MRCPRCAGYLIHEVHYERELDAGSYCDYYARCLACGNYIWRERLIVIVTIAELVERAHDFSLKCVVEGCDNGVTRKNESGFCRECSHALYNWRRAPTQANVMQPIILGADGRWVKAPESLTWRRKEKDYLPQRAAGGIRACRLCGKEKFIRKDGMCGKCLHATRGEERCIQCGTEALLSEKKLCLDCAARNQVKAWLEIGTWNKFFTPLVDEPEQERYDRLLMAAKKLVYTKRNKPVRYDRLNEG